MTLRFGTFGRAVAVSLTAGVALTLTGCGSDSSDGGSSGSASDSTNSTNSSDGDGALARDEIMTAAYEAAMEEGSAHIVMSTKGKAEASAQGDVSYGDGKSAMQMTMAMPQMGADKIEMRFVDQILYMQVPGMTTPGKFIAIDPKDESSPMSKSFAGLSDQMDPLSSVKQMQSAVTAADRVGTETIDGESTDRYKVTVDTASMTKKAGEPAPEGMPKSLTYDLWLDDDDLIRKMTSEVSGTSVEMLMSKWGEPVTVEKPAAGQIMKSPTA